MIATGQIPGGGIGIEFDKGVSVLSRHSTGSTDLDFERNVAMWAGRRKVGGAPTRKRMVDRKLAVAEIVMALLEAAVHDQVVRRARREDRHIVVDVVDVESVRR